MNAKHQFKYTYNEGCEEFSPVDVTFDMPGDVTISQMLWNFECYLKSCGFIFDGHLEVVPESGYDLKDEIEEEPPHCCMNDSDYKEDADAVQKWNERLAKLQAEVQKNNWVQGVCNPPSPDWKKKNSDGDSKNCWASYEL